MDSKGIHATLSGLRCLDPASSSLILRNGRQLLRGHTNCTLGGRGLLETRLASLVRQAVALQLPCKQRRRLLVQSTVCYVLEAHQLRDVVRADRAGIHVDEVTCLAIAAEDRMEEADRQRPLIRKAYEDEPFPQSLLRQGHLRGCCGLRASTWPGLVVSPVRGFAFTGEHPHRATADHLRKLERVPGRTFIIPPRPGMLKVVVSGE
mmetsp:Transcript_47936/g.126459  ORF Transcript_47936/g.126459 Transcript_47936/m.126459 type:complete len:206 (+) Transcript_47936:34-651(+)